jgi:hypothetical protein
MRDLHRVMIVIFVGQDLPWVVVAVGSWLPAVEVRRRDPFSAAVVAFSDDPAAGLHQWVVWPQAKISSFMSVQWGVAHPSTWWT